MASRSIEIPYAGLKIICIAGFFNGNPIWRQVGILQLSKGGKPMILLDRVFSPAGVQTEAPSGEGCYVMLNTAEFTTEEIAKKNGFQKAPAKELSPEKKSSSNFDDLDDDIPF